MESSGKQASGFQERSGTGRVGVVEGMKGCAGGGSRLMTLIYSVSINETLLCSLLCANYTAIKNLETTA